MEWYSLADGIFRLRWWFLPALAALYAVPLFRVAGLAFESGSRAFMPVNRLFGLWEHAVFLPRDTIVTAYLAIGFLWHAFWALELENPEHAYVAAAAIAFMGAGWAQRYFRREGHIAIAEFARRNPSVHPQEFFDHFVCISGAVRHRLPAEPAKTVDHAHLDFRNGRSAKLRWPALLCGAWSTAWIARLLVYGSDIKDHRWLRKLAGSLSLIWASRVAQLMRAEVRVDGKELLPAKGSPQMFLYTHASFLDFALASLALAARPQAAEGGSDKNSAPSFLMARDHFRDNLFYYRILGLGRAAEALGMIFVDRKGEATPSRARGVVWAAAEKMVEEKYELGVFPQGTRAVSCIGRSGERIDSAYYTVGSRSRIKKDGAHLKKGAAFIAAESAMEIAAAGRPDDVKVVPIAIRGTGIACPRGCCVILSNVQIRLVVGEPISVASKEIAGLRSPEQDEPKNQGEKKYFEFANHLLFRIDASLKAAAGVHAVLERRFFEDIRDLLDANELEEVSLAVKPWRGDDFLFHAVLDAIYCCRPAAWRRLVGELAHMMLNFSSREDLLAFKGRVADEIPI